MAASFTAYKTCVWVVTATSGSSVLATFTSVSLSGSNTIYIRDGYYNTSTMLGTLTSSSLTQSFVSSTAYLYVQFNVDADGHGATFMVAFSSTYTPCQRSFVFYHMCRLDEDRVVTAAADPLIPFACPVDVL